MNTKARNTTLEFRRYNRSLYQILILITWKTNAMPGRASGTRWPTGSLSNAVSYGITKENWRRTRRKQRMIHDDHSFPFKLPVVEGFTRHPSGTGALVSIHRTGKERFELKSARGGRVDTRKYLLWYGWHDWQSARVSRVTTDRNNRMRSSDKKHRTCKPGSAVAQRENGFQRQQQQWEKYAGYEYHLNEERCMQRSIWMEVCGNGEVSLHS
jgi:hypothetical protein